MSYQLMRQVQTIPVLGKFIRKLKYPANIVKYYLSHTSYKQDWQRRIQITMSSSDNNYIPRVSNAGKIINGYLVMHNGIKVLPASYAGEGMRQLLAENRGVHEPQEERVFLEVLSTLPQDATMLELGAYWGFYSMWFHSVITNPICYLLDPQLHHLQFGKDNFAANSMYGTFMNAFIGKSVELKANSIPTYSVDFIMNHYNIAQLHILHADIQGHEHEMLLGAQETLVQQRIHYLFISTHSDELHVACQKLILQYDYQIIADANLQETYSYDGIIVAKRADLPLPKPVAISKRS